MAATFVYTVTHTWTVSGGDNFGATLISPRPGTHLTGFSISIDAPAQRPTGVDLKWVGGAADGISITSALVSIGNTTGNATNLPQNDTTAATGYRLYPSCGAGSPTPYTVTYTVTITWSDAVPPGPCPYGASPNPSAAIYTVITDVLVEAVAAALGLGPLGLIALGTMIGAPITFPICGNVPALPPALVDADFIDGTGLPNPLSLGKWMQHFTYGIWLFYCQCNPAPSGSPPPTNPPVPVPPPRLAPGPQPSPPCSNTDVCSTLNRITNILTTINLSIQNTSYVQQEPAYTLGTLYTGLSGNGELAVSGILGVYVSFTTLPNRVGMEIGDPNELFDVGHITFGTVEAWFARNRISSNPWIVLPRGMANVSKVGYAIPADCVVQLRLLVAAPMNALPAPGT